MKKYIVLLMALVCILGLVSCSKENKDDMTNADKFLLDVQMVQVTFYSGPDVHEWELTQEEIEDWIVWLNGLILEQINENDTNIPGEEHISGLRYIFEINTEKECIQYVDMGEYGVYLLAESVWYKISNPSEPFNRY